MESAPTEALVEHDRERITKANQLQSPLLRLPAEIRNNIYYHVFHKTVVKVHPCWHRSYQNIKTGSIALLRTCRQVRNEAHGLFMSTITFNIRDRGIQEFVMGIDSTKAALVTSMICDFGEVQDFHGKRKQRYKSSCKGKLPGLVRLHLGGPDGYWVRKHNKSGTSSMVSFVMGHRSLANKVVVTFDS